MSLRNRIYLSMVLLVLVSFVIIGAITIWYTQGENERYHYKRLDRKERAIVLSLNYYLADTQNDSLAFYTQSFNQKVQELSDINKLDVNIFDLDGQWVSSSDFDFFDLGYIPEVLSDTLLKELEENKGSMITQWPIGDQNYLFALQYLKDKNGKPLAIINIPYFKSEQEFKEETSLFLTALTQVYALLLIIGLLTAYLLSNSITKGLKRLEGKIGQLSLTGQNQELEWEGKDEIASLVKSYNQKVRELEASVEKLTQSEREGAWREMAKQVAHEIKNPLTPMLLQVQQLERSWKDGREDFQERLEKFQKTMTEQIETLSRIATEFSNFAKWPEAKLQNLELNSCISNIVPLFTQENKVQIKLNLPQESIIINGDKDRITSVFNNLITNSIQAISEDRKGVIQIDVTLKKDFVIIDFSDNGTGIAENQIQKIFEPNFTTKSSGTGLGLAMVKNIINNMGGTIEVSSQQNVGTTFILNLPLLKTE